MVKSKGGQSDDGPVNQGDGGTLEMAPLGTAARLAQTCLSEVRLNPEDRRKYPATLYVRIDPYKMDLPRGAAAALGTSDGTGATAGGERGQDGAGGDGDRGEMEVLRGDSRVVVRANWRRNKGEPNIVPSVVQKTVPLPQGSFTLAFSPDGHYLAADTGEEDTNIVRGERRNHYPITLFHVHDAWTVDGDGGENGDPRDTVGCASSVATCRPFVDFNTCAYLMFLPLESSTCFYDLV